MNKCRVCNKLKRADEMYPTTMWCSACVEAELAEQAREDTRKIERQVIG